VVADELTPAPGGALASATTIRKVGVIGSGTMATGIIEVLAKAGYDVLYVTRGEEKVARVRADLERSLDKAVLRGKLEQADRDAALARVSGSAKLDDLADRDLVIEAVVEELSVKQALFATLDEICKPGAVLATTTSSLPVIDLAAATGRPADVVGLHFFNPAPVMRTVEIVHALQTDPELVQALVRLVDTLPDKTPVVVKDRPGFLVNALLLPYLNDVIQELDDGLATAEDIDVALELGLGYRTGPLAMLDMIGLDVHLHATESVYAATRDNRYAPPPLLRQMVAAGQLGTKSGHGFRTGRGDQ
jgi:3-hydroxybutyryl-CoA dehydrogenase